VDLIGEDTSRLFRAAAAHQGDRADAAVSRTTVRKVIRSRETEFKYERGVQPVPKLGEWVEVLTEILEKERSCRGGSADRPSGCSRSCAGAAMTVPTTACTAFRKSLAGRASAGTGAGVRADEFCARRGVSVRLEPRRRSLSRGLPWTIKAAHMKLSHSPDAFVRGLLPRTQSWCSDAHDKAFVFYGGVAGAAIYDNMKTGRRGDSSSGKASPI